jgi:prevent-host-death family protein
MAITASKLRENIYNILDEVAETGVPVEVIRKGVTLRIVAATKRSKLENLKGHRDYWTDATDDLAKSTWEQSDGYKEWVEEWKNFE